MPSKQRNLVLNARSYSGTLTESDHRLVVTTTTTPPAYKRIFGSQPVRQVKHNVALLPNNENMLAKYQDELIKKLSEIQKSSLTPFEKWTAVRACITHAADMSIGKAKKRQQRTDCPIIEQFSKDQHQLRVQIINTFEPNTRKQLQNRRNKILVAIRKQQVNRAAHRRDQQAKRQRTHVQAVRELTSHKPRALVVKNAAGEKIGQEEEAAKVVAKIFKKFILFVIFFL